MNPPRAILFDAAGTLIEPAEPVAAVYARQFAASGYVVDESLIGSAFGRAFREIPSPDYPARGDGDRAERSWWRALVRETALRCGLPEQVAGSATLFDSLFDYYAEGAAWRVFPETREVMETLANDGFPMAVVSNFDNRLHRILADLNLADWFCPIVTSADACSRKPDSRIFRYALDQLDLCPSEVVHIGDSTEADVLGAGGIGIRAFLLDRPGRSLRDAAEWIRSDLKGK